MIRELKQQALDIGGAIRDVFIGKSLDPKRFAEKPPKWWHKKNERPEAEPPKKKERKAPTDSIADSAMWAEIMQMSDEEWVLKYGAFSAIRWNEKYGALQNQRFSSREEMLDWLESEKNDPRSVSEIDFDAEAQSELTRRECGELLAYVPRLDDFELAAKVKRMKAQGLSLKAISERTLKPYQTIKHYSSALGKAQE